MELVSPSVTPGTSANGGSTLPVVSDDGRFVAYLSRATDLVAGVHDANNWVNTGGGPASLVSGDPC